MTCRWTLRRAREAWRVPAEVTGAGKRSVSVTGRRLVAGDDEGGGAGRMPVAGAWRG